MDEPKRVSAPIRLDPELLEKVKEAAKKTGLAQADVMRLCLAIGIEDLRRVNFDLVKLVADAAQVERSHAILKVAEDEGKALSPSTRVAGAQAAKYPRGRGGSSAAG